jgi:hypothetical protein
MSPRLKSFPATIKKKLLIFSMLPNVKIIIITSFLKRKIRLVLPKVYSASIIFFFLLEKYLFFQQKVSSSSSLFCNLT